MDDRKTLKELYKNADSKLRNKDSGLISRFENNAKEYNLEKQDYTKEYLQGWLSIFQGYAEEFLSLYDIFLGISNNPDSTYSNWSKIRLDYINLLINKIQNIYIVQINQKLNQIDVDESLEKANESIGIGRRAITIGIIVAAIGLVAGLGFGGGVSWWASYYYYEKGKPDDNNIEKVYKEIITFDSLQVFGIQERLDSIQWKNIELHKQIESIGQELESRETLNLQLIQTKDISLKIEALEKAIQKLIEKEEGLHSLIDSVLFRENESTN